MLQKVMSHIAAVKKDMIILEKSEFSALLAENEVRPLSLFVVFLYIICLIYNQIYYVLKTGYFADVKSQQNKVEFLGLHFCFLSVSICM